MANRYANAVVYKLCADDIDIVYIGSTCNIERRMREHKSGAKTGKRYCKSKILYDLSKSTVKYEIVEECVGISTANQLTLRERYWILNTPNVVNYDLPTNLSADLSGKSRDAARMVLWRRNNADKIKETKSAPYQCACGSTVQICEVTRHNKTKKHLAHFAFIPDRST
jgi:predicted GIY-YIG superfamily endonuclease